jgi:hypothetical protein
MSAPAQIVEPDPRVVGLAWQNEEQMWKTLSREAFGCQDFHPITTKAMYVLGVIHSICTSVTALLKGPIAATYLPAYGVLASGIDLLGRCIRGNPTPRTAPQRDLPSDLLEGFRWLANSYYRGQVPNDIIQTNNNRRYAIDYLVALRHFAAHGQATTRYQLQDIDYEIIERLKPLVIEGLDTYWERLKSDDQDLSNNLARANVMGFRALPVQVILELFSPDPVTGEDLSVLKLFNRFDWRVAV